MKLVIVFFFVLAAVAIIEAGKAKHSARSRLPKRHTRHTRHLSHKQKEVKTNYQSANNNTAPLSHPRKLKAFDGPGPYRFDFLIAEYSHVNSDFDVVFIDADLAESDITKYLNEGKTVICYVNVGAFEDWRSDAAHFPDEVLGNTHIGWEGERWLDISNTDVLVPIMRERFRKAAAKGCHGIDPDHMNTYLLDRDGGSGSGFGLTYDNQIIYNRYISAEVRALGMVVGLKNDGEQAADLVESSDFAVVESCAVRDDCGFFDVFIATGRPVFSIEYTADWDESSFLSQVCPLVNQTGMGFILKYYTLGSVYTVSCI